jgi:hypothetical protein
MNLSFATKAICFVIWIATIGDHFVCSNEHEEEQAQENVCRLDDETKSCRENMVQNSILVEDYDMEKSVLKDEHSKCGHWAKIGECDTNPK